MSWLSGIAGKAEDLLNKIDKNAALALQKGQGSQVVDNSVLVDVASQGESSLSERTTVMNSFASLQSLGKSLTVPRSYPNTPAATGPSLRRDNEFKPKSSTEDEDLMIFLNSPSTTPRKIRKKNDNVAENRAKEGPSLVPQWTQSTVTTPSKAKREFEVEAQNQIKDGESIEVVVGDGESVGGGCTEPQKGEALRNEVRLKEQQLHATCQKLTESQQEVDLLCKRLASMELHLSEVKDMYKGAIEDSKKIAEAAIAERFQAQGELDRMKNEFSYSMDDKTRALEVLKTKMEGELVAANNKTKSLQKRYDALVEELRNERLEREKYRARAQAVLAGRDREIADLRAEARGTRCESAIDPDPTVDGEREDEAAQRQMWEEEAVKLQEEVVRLRGVVEDVRTQWEGDRERMEDDLLMERGRREAAEEQERVTAQELRGARAEFERVRQVELELRQKLSLAEERKVGGRRGGDWGGGGRAILAGDVADDSVSERLAALTSTLIEKQIRVESLTAERNALRLQLEKTDHLYRDAVAHLGQVPSTSVPGQNDTDDVKARIPSFLLESPFDTAVARKVKRAYSSLDSVGVRVGIFLRRYPLARTLLLSYTVLLHLWVVIVLLTYTPDVH